MIFHAMRAVLLANATVATFVARRESSCDAEIVLVDAAWRLTR